MISPTTAADRPASRLTPLQRWRRARNAVIVLAARGGASVRMIALAHDLDPGRVSQILKQCGVKPGGRGGTQPG